MKFDLYNRKWSHGEEEVEMPKKARGHLGVLREDASRKPNCSRKGRLLPGAAGVCDGDR